MASADGEVTHGLRLSARNDRQNRIPEVDCLICFKMPVFHLNYPFPLVKHTTSCGRPVIVT